MHSLHSKEPPLRSAGCPPRKPGEVPPGPQRSTATDQVLGTQGPPYSMTRGGSIQEAHRREAPILTRPETPPSRPLSFHQPSFHLAPSMRPPARLPGALPFRTPLRPGEPAQPTPLRSGSHAPRIRPGRETSALRSPRLFSPAWTSPRLHFHPPRPQDCALWLGGRPGARGWAEHCG